MARIVRGSTKASSLDERIRSTEPIEGFSHIEFGTYDGFVVINRGALIKKDDSGKRVFLMVQVDDDAHPEYSEAGRKEAVSFNLENDYGLGRLLGILKEAEISKPQNERELADAVAELDRMRCNFSVKQGKDKDGKANEFVNVYINQVFPGEYAGEHEDTPPATDDAGTDDSLEALGAAADNGDEDAIDELTAQAEAAGINPDDVETWAEVAAMLAA